MGYSCRRTDPVVALFFDPPPPPPFSLSPIDPALSLTLSLFCSAPHNFQLVPSKRRERIEHARTKRVIRERNDPSSKMPTEWIIDESVFRILTSAFSQYGVSLPLTFRSISLRMLTEIATFLPVLGQFLLPFSLLGWMELVETWWQWQLFDN